MTVTFNPTNHTYVTDEGKILISVTQLLRKHSITPDFSGVKKDVLEFKAQRGTMIHKELEDFIKNGEIGFTSEFEFFRENIYPRFRFMLSECILFTDKYAGTADIIALDFNDNLWIIDTKTGQVHKDPTRWQLSLYLTALFWMLEHGINVLDLDKNVSVHLAIFDAKEEDSRFYEVAQIPYENVQKLLKCEEEEIVYGTDSALDASLADKALQFECIIKTIKAQQKKYEEDYAKLKSQILTAMQKNSIKNFSTDSISITVKSAYDQTRVDSDKLKSSYPDIYKACTKISHCKESLTITVKD